MWERQKYMMKIQEWKMPQRYFWGVTGYRKNGCHAVCAYRRCMRYISQTSIVHCRL